LEQEAENEDAIGGHDVLIPPFVPKRKRSDKSPLVKTKVRRIPIIK
jgi:hypothetical protein